MTHIEFDLNWIEILKTSGLIGLGIIVGIIILALMIGKPY